MKYVSELSKILMIVDIVDLKIILKIRENIVFISDLHISWLMLELIVI